MFLLKYWKSILASSLVFYVSIIRIPPVKIVEFIPYFDKMVHFGMYFTIATCFFLDFIRTSPSLSWIKKVAIMVVIPSLYGGLIEILQGAYFPPRSAQWSDFFADCLGSLVACLICNKLQLIKLQRDSA
jgi:VanZ family protein